MCKRHSVSKQADYKVDLLNDVTSHKRNIHINRRIRTNDPWSPRATYVLSVPGIVVAAAAETPCGLVMCANCNPVYFKQMITWDQALFSFRFENYIPAGKTKRKESLIQTFNEMSAAHFFDWLTFVESANQNYFGCLFFYYANFSRVGKMQTGWLKR